VLGRAVLGSGMKVSSRIRSGDFVCVQWETFGGVHWTCLEG
jgi:hypothetical protein